MQVAELIEVLSALPGGQPVDWLVPELADAIPAIMATESRLAALRFEAIAAFDAQGGAQDAGHRSTADWLTKTTRVSHAGAMVHTARSLRDDLPQTAAALASGQITEAHVQSIRKGLRMLGDDFADIEGHVVGAATVSSTKELRAFVDLIIQQYSPEISDDKSDVAREKRKVYLARSTDGWWHLNGLLDPATGELLQAAFDVTAARTSEDDDRSPAMRRVDGLAEIAKRAVTGIDRPTGHGHVTLTMTQDQFDSGLGVSWPSGSLLTRNEVGQHTCESEVALLITGDGAQSWEPLQLGMTARYASRAQRVALQARDGDTCVHPGCSTRASRCIAHHIVHWNEGGPTDLENLVLICEFHHRKVHHGRLEIVADADGYRTSRRRVPV